MNPTDLFRAEMSKAGLGFTSELIADGKLRRFRCEDDKEKNSWYVLFHGPPYAGAFGCWKRNVNEKWCERKSRAMPSTESQRLRDSWQRADEERERAQQERHAEARAEAVRILSDAKAPQAHAYLERKSVNAFGDVRERDGKLVLPLRDASGELHSLQFIDGNGSKKFLTGGRVTSCFFSVADKPEGPLIIAEGYATAATLHAATGFATVAGLNCGNMFAVAKALRARWPERELILAADDDRTTGGNPGLTAASDAAKAFGAKLAVPKFADVTDKLTDFNDLHQREGLAVVKAQIEAAAQVKESDAETYARLAKLSLPDYDRARDAEAKRLGIKGATLDKQVVHLRPKAKDNSQGFAVELPDVEPWPEAVDGAEVLSEVAAVLSHYVFLPDGAADAITLWISHSHCFEAFLHTPRLNLRSAEKGCGKTTLLDVLSSLTPRAMRTESMTSAVLFRVIDRHRPTLLLDEVDAYLDENEELRGLLNAGHRRGARAYRVEGDNLDVRGFNAFAPAVLAGIGGLTGKLLTLHDRSVVVDLVRAKPGEITARFDSRRTAHETELCRKLAKWTGDNFDRLQSSDPAMPSGAFNRLADNWRPLFAVAEVAGGDWPARAAAAFAKLTSTTDVDAQGIGATLLTDIAAIFATAREDKLPSVRICEGLSGIEGRPWAEWGKARKPISPNQLANQLRRFKVSKATSDSSEAPHIAPRSIKLADGSTAKGYHLEDFCDAFARFAPTPAIPDRNPVTTPANIDDSAVSKSSPAEDGLRIENAQNPNETGQGYGVTVQKPHSPEFANADLW